MIKNVKGILLFAAFLVGGAGLAGLCWSCCGSTNLADMPDEVKSYYEKDLASADENESLSAYFDLSNGIIEAYRTV